MSKPITLHSGPYNRRTIPDLGTVRIIMSIADRWEGNRPAIGARCGIAIYEPDRNRRHAHWLCNVWKGRIVAIIE